MNAKQWTHIGRAASLLGLSTAAIGLFKDAATLISVGALVVSCGALAVAHSPGLLDKLVDSKKKGNP